MAGMRRILSLATLVLLLAGCGGGGGSSEPSVSPFTGSYEGTDDGDPVTLLVNEDGTFLGTSANSDLGGTDTLIGKVSSGGNFRGSIYNTTDVSNVIDVTGKFTGASTGATLTVFVSAKVGDESSTDTFTLTKVTEPAVSPFAGTFVETTEDPASMSIQNNGNVLISFTDSETGEKVDITGRVDSKGRFFGKVTNNASDEILLSVGTFLRTGTRVTVNLAFTDVDGETATFSTVFSQK